MQRNQVSDLSNLLYHIMGGTAIYPCCHSRLRGNPVDSREGGNDMRPFILYTINARLPTYSQYKQYLDFFKEKI